MLVLWDIDHTLLKMRGLGRELFNAAFARVTGQRMERQAMVQGSTDLTIFRATAQLHGIQPDDELVEAFVTALGDVHAGRAAEVAARARALPGAGATLDAVAETGTRQSVVTGNVRRSAQVKLAATGLDTPIDWTAAACGDEHQDRADLVRLALHRATQTSPVGSVVLVGDTPADVWAARAAGVRPVAVTTGHSSGAELRAAGAAVVLPDLTDAAQVARVLARPV